MDPVFPFDLRLPAPGTRARTGALHRELRTAILDGRLAPGTMLPSTRAVATALHVARNTVVTAYDRLVAEGYLLPRRGARPQVAALPHRPRPPLPAPRVLPRTVLFAGPEPRRELPVRCFRLGIPDSRHFPHALWRRVVAQAMRQAAREPFGYGPSQGLPALREAIAAHVAFARAVACTAAQVLVTSGAQQAFDLIARLFVTPGQTCVAVEDPGYPPLRAAFAAAGARLTSVPVDDEGLQVDRLPDDVRVVCVTPSHQSPTGVAMSMARRLALLAFARRTGAVILEDDYDGEFRFGGRPLDALQTLDRDGCVFYVGTFSKSLFPSLRKGFVVAPEWARDALVAVRHCADSHSDTIIDAALATFIREGHLARHVRHMRPIYAARREALMAALRGPLSPWLEPIPCEAGLHLAAWIRDPALAPMLFEAARRWLPGAQSTADYAPRPPSRPALTIGYGCIDVEAIEPAVAAMGRALRRAGR